MHPVALLFGLACGGALIASMRGGSAIAQVFALLLGIVWASANVLWLLDAMWLLPLVDLPLACLSYAIWRGDEQRWQAWLAGAYAARLTVHAVATFGLNDTIYKHLINALFLAALIAVAWEGAIKDGIGVCMGRIRRLRDLYARLPSQAFRLSVDG